jgi:hypothetical protein
MPQAHFGALSDTRKNDGILRVSQLPLKLHCLSLKLFLTSNYSFSTLIALSGHMTAHMPQAVHCSIFGISATW